ncbi:hypothetical protein [Roseateles sp.]|uniref:hypothetical protein n=1 Tax=Roseateles sp. TaxID=1971397 RepID=UPI003949E88D
MTPNLTRASEEFVSEPFALPGGRLVAARLIVLPSTPAGPVPREPHTLQLAVEVRATPEADFERVGETPVLSQWHEGRAEVAVPTPVEPIEPGVRPPLARLRLIHQGALQPRFDLRIVGL